MKPFAEQRYDVQLDWRAYFLAFAEQHGGDPLTYGGRLLFQDGWTYSSTDYAGPEWPPPSSEVELLALQLYYWRRRRGIVQHELNALRNQLSALVGMQSAKSAPLQQVKTAYDAAAPEGQRLTRTTGPVNIEAMRGREEWLAEDISLCNRKLEELASSPVQAQP